MPSTSLNLAPVSLEYPASLSPERRRRERRRRRRKRGRQHCGRLWSE